MIERAIKDNKTQVFLSMIPLLLLGILAPLRSWIFQQVIDSTSAEQLLKQGFIATVFSALVFLFEWISRKLQTAAVMRIEQTIRNLFFTNICKMSSYQFEQKNTSYYLSKITTDIKLIIEDGINNLYDMILQGLFLIVAVIYLLIVEPYMLLIIAVICTIQLIVPSLLKKKIIVSRKSFTEIANKYLEKLRDYLNNEKLFKQFCAVNQLIQEQNRITEAYSNANRKTNSLFYSAKALASYVNNFSFLIVLVSCMVFAILHRITIGEVVAITNIMNFVLAPCETITNGYIRLKSLASIRMEIDSLLEETSEEEGKKTFNGQLNTIHLDNVSQEISDSFSLKNISLEINTGRKYAIIGSSGSGKTSLIKLITEYGPTYAGEASINGVSLDCIEKNSFTYHCPVMTQKTAFLTDTLRNNITLYQDYTDQEIWDVLQKVGLGYFREQLSNGLDEMVLEKGSNFSGGEGQRICLARILIRNPQAIFADEFTSGLDKETAFRLEELLLNDTELTFIHITHQYTKHLLEKYNWIFVMDHGEIVEQGTLDTLLEKEGLLSAILVSGN